MLNISALSIHAQFNHYIEFLKWKTAGITAITFDSSTCIFDKVDTLIFSEKTQNYQQVETYLELIADSTFNLIHIDTIVIDFDNEKHPKWVKLGDDSNNGIWIYNKNADIVTFFVQSVKKTYCYKIIRSPEQANGIVYKYLVAIRKELD